MSINYVPFPYVYIYMSVADPVQGTRDMCPPFLAHKVGVA